MRTTAIMVALLSGCSAGSVSVSVTHGLTGEPIGGARVLLSASGDVGLNCQMFDGTTGADGSVEIGGPCVGQTGYKASLGEEVWWIPDGAALATGGSQLELVAYPAPTGAGLYQWASTSGLVPLRTHSDVKSETGWDSEEEIEFPSALPREDDIPRLGPGSTLVVTGADNITGLTVTPMIRSEEPRKFGNDTQWTRMQPWWYLGVAFESDAVWTRHEAAFDESKVVRKEGQTRAALFVPHDALPPGRYAFRTPRSRRLTVVDIAAE